MQLPRVWINQPTGLSFEIADLVLLTAWSEFHGLRLAIDLDVCADEEEYEEFVGLYDRSCAFRRWMIWRSCDGIVVQPAMAHRMLFDCMSEILEFLIPPPAEPPQEDPRTG